jgi:endoglucanase
MLTIGPAQITLLEKLCHAVGVSGDEGEVRKIVLEEVKPFADEVKVDALGNVLVTKRGRGRNRLRVLLDAHMDEVGLMIVAEDGDGIYRFQAVGAVDSRQLAGKQVLVGREHKPGVIGVTPIHLLSGDDTWRKIDVDALRIDLGPGGTASVGDRAAFATKFRRLGPSILSKAIDDRIGVAILIELLKHAPANVDLYLAFTVQEEVGLRGAMVAARSFCPDLAFVIDSTPANDLPTHDGRENIFYNTKLGSGPAIYTTAGLTVQDPRLVRFLQETAEATGIPFQFRQPGGGSTNSGAIQLACEGIPAVSVSVPHRYTHTAISISRLDDWKDTLNLMHAALGRVHRDLVTTRP